MPNDQPAFIVFHRVEADGATVLCALPVSSILVMKDAKPGLKEKAKSIISARKPDGGGVGIRFT